MIVFTDGSTVGWNGPLGMVKEIGVGVYIPDLAWEFSRREHGESNNVAELRAVVRGLQISLGYRDVTIMSDSRIVETYLNRGKTVAIAPHLQRELTTINALKAHFNSVNVAWIPREQNEIADRLAYRAASGLTL